MKPSTSVNQLQTRLAAASLNVICILYYNILALVIGSAADDRGLTADQLGVAASSFLLGLTLINFSGALWLRRYNWRWLVAIGNLTAAAAFLLPVFWFSFSTWLLSNLLAGLATGLCYGVSLACLGDGDEPEKNFGLAYLGQTILSAGVIFLLPRVSTSMDIFALGHWIVAALSCFGVALVWLIPPRSEKFATRAAVSPIAFTKSTPAHTALILALGVLVVNVIAEGAVWTFLERIIVNAGFDTLFAANLISASFLTAGLGSLIAVVLGKRLGRTKPFVVAVAASIVSVVLLWTGTASATFIVAVLLFAGAWNLGSPYRMALAMAADSSGRFSTLVPAMQTLGAALGPAIAGLLIANGSFSPVYLMAIALWIATVFMFIRASKLLKA